MRLDLGHSVSIHALLLRARPSMHPACADSAAPYDAAPSLVATMCAREGTHPARGSCVSNGVLGHVTTPHRPALRLVDAAGPTWRTPPYTARALGGRAGRARWGPSPTHAAEPNKEGNEDTECGHTRSTSPPAFARRLSQSHPRHASAPPDSLSAVSLRHVSLMTPRVLRAREMSREHVWLLLTHEHWYSGILD